MEEEATRALPPSTVLVFDPGTLAICAVAPRIWAAARPTTALGLTKKTEGRSSGLRLHNVLGNMGRNPISQLGKIFLREVSLERLQTLRDGFLFRKLLQSIYLDSKNQPIVTKLSLWKFESGAKAN